MERSVFQSHMISGANDLNPSPHITLFTSGCNFKCGYCFNPSLVSETVRVKLSKTMVANYVGKYAVTHPLVVVTGGEPLMHTRLVAEVGFLKDMVPDARFELCTNGSLPNQVEYAVQSGVFDSYRIDYKLPRDTASADYLGVVGYARMLDDIERSIIIVRESGKDLEVRTVFHSHYLDNKMICEIMDRVSKLKVQNYGIIYFTDESRTVGATPPSDSSKLDVGMIKEMADELNLNLRLYRNEQY